LLQAEMKGGPGMHARLARQSATVDIQCGASARNDSDDDLAALCIGRVPNTMIYV